MDYNHFYNESILNKEDDAAIIQHLRNLHFEKRNELLARALAARHYRNGDYHDLAALVDAMIDFNILGDYPNQPAIFVEYASIINKMSIDQNLLKKALRWMDVIDMNELPPIDKTKYFKVKEALDAKL